jgi:hypothetical protein
MCSRELNLFGNASVRLDVSALHLKVVSDSIFTVRATKLALGRAVTPTTPILQIATWGKEKRNADPGDFNRRACCRTQE